MLGRTRPKPTPAIHPLLVKGLHYSLVAFLTVFVSVVIIVDGCGTAGGAVAEVDEEFSYPIHKMWPVNILFPPHTTVESLSFSSLVGKYWVVSIRDIDDARRCLVSK